MTVRVKICGVRTAEDVSAALGAGAAYLGLNFFAKSPRSVTMAQGRALSHQIPLGRARVGLIVDMDDAFIKTLVREVPLDIIQLHGTETPERVQDIRTMTGLPVMKAVGVSGADDLPNLDTYAAVADMLLVDAKPPKNADLPGGNGVAFDWSLIAGRRWTVPWMVAGGLTPDNVAQAIAQTGTRQVDVSSGVESAPGVKDPDKMAAFIQATA